MTPLKTKATTSTLGAPMDWDEEKDGPCIGLPVQDLGVGFSSWWKPSWSERLWLLLGRPIRFTLRGITHPPVELVVTKEGE